MEPSALQESDWTISPSFNVSFEAPASMSQSLTVKSPDAEARTFSAAGLNRTCPTFLKDVRLAQILQNRILPWVTTQLADGRNVLRFLSIFAVDREIVRDSPQKDLCRQYDPSLDNLVVLTFPSSEADAIKLSLNGFLPTNQPLLYFCQLGLN